MEKNSLGPLDVATYLDYYGIKYRISPEQGRVLFLLDQCLFTTAHKMNMAAIIQEEDGTLFYHCAHPSCKDRTWRQARVLISGNDSLARFMICRSGEIVPPGEPAAVQPGFGAYPFYELDLDCRFELFRMAFESFKAVRLDSQASGPDQVIEIYHKFCKEVLGG